MAQFMPYLYTSVSNGSTFGLLHPCTNSSIVCLSASTLVPEILCSADADNSSRFRVGSLGLFKHWSRARVCLNVYEFSPRKVLTSVARTSPYDYRELGKFNMPNDLLNRDNFGLLPEPEGRWGSFGVSMITNVSIMALLVLLTAAVHKVEKQKYIEHMVFTEQTPPPPPPRS